jgi:hypothetical protein
VPISRDEFQTLTEDRSRPDLAPDTTQGTLYRFLLAHPDKAFRQREIVEETDVPRGSVGPTLARLEEHGLLDHRGHYWTIADTEHAVDTAATLGTAAATARDDGFSDEEIETWMETAVDPIERSDDSEDQ